MKDRLDFCLQEYQASPVEVVSLLYVCSLQMQLLLGVFEDSEAEWRWKYFTITFSNWKCSSHTYQMTTWYQLPVSSFGRRSFHLLRLWPEFAFELVKNKMQNDLTLAFDFFSASASAAIDLWMSVGKLMFCNSIFSTTIPHFAVSWFNKSISSVLFRSPKRISDIVWVPLIRFHRIFNLWKS